MAAITARNKTIQCHSYFQENKLNATAGCRNLILFAAEAYAALKN